VNIIMQDLHWECSVCEACGVCGRTEDNCAVYHEFYQIQEVQLGTADLYSEYTQYEAPVAAVPVQQQPMASGAALKQASGL
jgi:hypothetical protein